MNPGKNIAPISINITPTKVMLLLSINHTTGFSMTNATPTPIVIYTIIPKITSSQYVDLSLLNMLNFIIFTFN